MAGLNGMLAVLGPKLALIQAISVVTTNCKEGSKMLCWSTCCEMILDVGMPRECQALSDCHHVRDRARDAVQSHGIGRNWELETLRE